MTQNISSIIANSIARSVDHPDLIAVLGNGMPTGRLQSVLLSVFEQRTRMWLPPTSCDAPHRRTSFGRPR